jgi:hypothetical protein
MWPDLRIAAVVEAHDREREAYEKSREVLTGESATMYQRPSIQGLLACRALYKFLVDGPATLGDPHGSPRRDEKQLEGLHGPPAAAHNQGPFRLRCARGLAQAPESSSRL